MLLGENGAFAWANSGSNVCDLYSIEGGNRVMQFWSELRAIDGIRQVYMQIVNADGSLEHDPPQVLSEPQAICGRVRSATDQDGNLIVAWFAILPDDPNTLHLMYMRYDQQGAQFWNGEPGEITRFEFGADDTPTLKTIIPDDRNGFYFIHHNGIIAIDENFNLRDNWRWHLQGPLEYTSFRKWIADGAGGLWVEHLDSNLEVYVYNHLTYEGDLLWDDFQALDGEDFPEMQDYGAKILAGANGGALCHYKLENERRLFCIDPDGNFMGEEYHFILPHPEEFRFTLIKQAFVLDDGRIVIHYQVHPNRDEYTDVLTIYDPEENVFPWGIAGVVTNTRFGNDGDFPSTWVWSTSLLELSNEDLILIIGLHDSDLEIEYWAEIYRVESEGELVWDEPFIIRHHLFLANIASGSENGFWLFGSSTRGRFGRTPFYFQRHNSDGTPAFEENANSGIRIRSIIYHPYAWVNHAYDYQLISREMYVNNYILQTIGNNGQIIGDPEGRIVLQSPILSDYSWSGKALQCGNIHITLAASRTSPRVFAVNDAGELQWSTILSELTNWDTKKVDIQTSSDEQYVVIILNRWEEVRILPTVFLINAEDGDLLLQRELTPDRLPERGRSTDTQLCNLLIQENEIYTLYAKDTLFVHKLDYDGEDLWENPFIQGFHREEAVTVPVPRADGGLWIGKYWLEGGYMDERMAWLEGLSPDNPELVDTIEVYSEPLQGEIRGEIFTGADLVYSQGNIWFVPVLTPYAGERIHIIPGIQCINTAGERIIGDFGILPENQDEIEDNDLMGCSDGEGGLWVVWKRGDDYFYRRTFAMHLDANGELMDGWNAEGNPVFEEALGRENSFIGSIGNGDLLLVAANEKHSPFDEMNNHHFRIQHLSEQPRQSVENNQSSHPVDFKINRVFPNPFNSQIQIDYKLSKSALLEMSIFNMAGRRIHHEVTNNAKSGSNSITIDASTWPSGLYLTRLNAGNDIKTVKLLCLK